MAVPVSVIISREFQQWCSFPAKVRLAPSAPHEDEDLPHHQQVHRKGPPRDVRLAPLVGGLSSVSVPSVPTPLPNAPSASGRQSLWWRAKAWLQDYYKHIQRIDVQVSLMPWELYFLSGDDLVCLGLPTSQSLSALIASRKPRGFVLSSPRFSLLNAAAKEWSPVHQVPLRSLPAGLTSEHLPWRIAASGLSCRHLGANTAILAPVDATCTLAVTAKFHSPLSEALTSLAWCLHLDMTPIQLHWTHPQLVEAVRLAAALSQSASVGASYWRDFLTVLAASQSSTGTTTVVPAPTATTSRRSGQPKTTSNSDDRSVSSSGAAPAASTGMVRRGPKLSLWLQWTLARGSVAFAVGAVSPPMSAGGERVQMDLGECTMSLDVQEHFSQFKVKIGHAVCRTRSAGGQTSLVFGSEGKYLRQFRAAGPAEALTSPQHVPEAGPSADMTPGPSPEQNRRFLTLILTRASARDVRKKFRKLRGDLESVGEALASGGKRQQFPQAAYLNELSAALEPTDVVLSSQLLRELEAFAALIASCWPQGSVREEPELEMKKKRKTEERKPWLIVSQCPLLYLDLKSIRLFLTTDAASLPAVDNLTSPDDTLLVTLNALSVMPYSENPLERVPVNEELFAQVQESDCLGHLGSAVEDRQYQMEIRGLSLSSGRWGRLLLLSGAAEERAWAAATSTSIAQVPALEWNRLTSDAPVGGIVTHSILTKLDLNLCFAPAIYSSPSSSIKDHLICGYSAELNVVSDMQWMVSLNQLRLVRTLLASVHCPSEQEENEKMDPEEEKEEENVAKENKTSEANSIADHLGASLTPFSLLLTARAISLALVDSSASGEAVRLLALARADHPYSLARVGPSRQRLALSCFDLRLRLPSEPQPPTLSEAELLTLLSPRGPEPEWLTDILSTRPGLPSPKTGVAPSLYTLEWCDFLAQPGALRIALERPLQLRMELPLFETLLPTVQHLSDLLSTPSTPKKTPIKRRGCSGPDLLFAGLSSLSAETGPVAVLLGDGERCLELGMAGMEVRVQLEVRCQREWQRLEARLRAHLLRITDLAAQTGLASRLMLAPMELEARAEASRFASGPCETWGAAAYVDLSGLDCRLGHRSLHSAKILYERLAAFVGSGGNDSKEKTSDRDPQEVHFKDDLRAAGQYSYTDALDGDVCPSPREIAFLHADSFSSEAASEEGWQEAVAAACGMAWRYPQPRRLTRLDLTPVPFTFVEVAAQRRRATASLRVPCHLQMWRSSTMGLAGAFHTVARFFWSDSRQQQVPLPPSARQEAACVWRLLVEGNASEEDDSTNEERESNRCLVHVPARSLAACMRVDSVFTPSLVPLISLNWSVARVHLQFFNQIDPTLDLAPALSDILTPFSLSQNLLPAEEECVHLRLVAPSGGFSVSGAGDLKLSAASCAEFAAVDLRCGAEELLSPSSRWAIQARLEQQKCSLRVRCDSPLELRVSPNSVHVLRHVTGLISTAMTSPSSFRLELGARIFVANRTAGVLYLQQADRTRQVAMRLAPGEALPWRWVMGEATQRSSWRVGVLLKDGQTILWSPEVLAPTDRKALVWDSPCGRLRMAILALRPSPTVTKFIFAPDLLLCNLTCHELSAQVGNSLLTVSEFATQSSGPLSLLAETNEVRLSAGSGATDVLQLSPGEQVVQIATASGQPLSCWCHIYRFVIDEEPFLAVVLCPLFLLDNRLPSSLELLLSFGGGTEERLLLGAAEEPKGLGAKFCGPLTAPDPLNREADVRVTARIGEKAPAFEPPIDLNAAQVIKGLMPTSKTPLFESLFDLSAFKYPTEAEEVDISSEEDEEEEGDGNNEAQKTWEALSRNSLVCVRLMRRWTDLNAVSLRFAPWLVLSNECSWTVLLQQGEAVYHVPPGDVLVPPDCKDLLRLGVSKDSQSSFSSPLILVAPESRGSSLSRVGDVGGVLSPGIPPLSLWLRCPQASGSSLAVSLSAGLVRRAGIGRLRVESRYVILNRCPMALRCRPLALPANRLGPPIRLRDVTAADADLLLEPRSSKSEDVLWWAEVKAGSSPETVPERLFLLLSASEGAPLWSLPLELHFPTNRTEMRRCVGVPFTDASGNLRCLHLALCAIRERHRIFLELSEDPHPALLLENRSPWDLIFGEKSLGTHPSPVLPEAEFCMDTALLPASSSLSYCLPSSDKTFPELPSSNPDPPQLRFSLSEPSGPEWSEAVGLRPGDVSLTLSEDRVLLLKVRKEESSGLRILLEAAPNPACERSAGAIRNSLAGAISDRGKVEAAPAGSPSWSAGLRVLEASVTLMEEDSTSWLPFLRVSIDTVAITAVDGAAVASEDFVMVPEEEEEEAEEADALGWRVRLRAASFQVDDCAAARRQHDFAVVCASRAAQGATDLRLRLQNSSCSAFDLRLGPTALCLEDRFLRDLVALGDTFPAGNRRLRRHVSRQEAVTQRAFTLAPLRLQRFRVAPLDLHLSVHASLKLFLSVEGTPLRLAAFDRRAIYASNEQFSRTLAFHYLTGALFRAGLVLGSLELLGNPTGLVRSACLGLTDLFQLPYAGLARGPGGLVTGMGQGVASLVRHSLAGLLGSLTSLASSVQRNLDFLSLDADHQRRQEAFRHAEHSSLVTALRQGLTGFGWSLLGAVAGMADQPLQAILSSDGSSSTARLLAAGLGRGLVGAVAKPLGGAAGLVAHTGAGLMAGAGLASARKPRKGPDEVPVVVSRAHPAVDGVSELLASLLVGGEALRWLCAAVRLDEDSGQAGPVLLALSSLHLLAWSPGLETEPALFPLAEVRIESSPAGPDCLLVLSASPGCDSSASKPGDVSPDPRIEEFIQGVAGLDSESSASSNSSPPVLLFGPEDIPGPTFRLACARELEVALRLARLLQQSA